MTKMDLVNKKSQYIREVYGIEVKEAEYDRNHVGYMKFKCGKVSTDEILFEISLEHELGIETEDLILRVYDQVINYMSGQK